MDPAVELERGGHMVRQTTKGDQEKKFKKKEKVELATEEFWMPQREADLHPPPSGARPAASLSQRVLPLIFFFFFKTMYLCAQSTPAALCDEGKEETNHKPVCPPRRCERAANLHGSLLNLADL